MKKVFIWGTGHIADLAFEGAKENELNIYNNEVFRIEGVIDNNRKKWGSEFHGFRVVSPGELVERDYDYIIALMDEDWDVRIQAIFGYRVLEKRFKNKYYFLQLLLTLKYKNCEDRDIKKILAYFDHNDISMFNCFLPNREIIHEVIWDQKINLPFIYFEDIIGNKRKMYFPRNYQFIRENGIEMLPDLMWEQIIDSPHRYIEGEHTIKDGDIVVDGGVCEGNFALRYLSITSKMYLYEPDWWWDEAHYYTFLPFRDKVVYSHKALSNHVGAQYTTIDRSVHRNDTIDFIKLDIEGSEADAIEGAESTLRKSNAKVSVCCYHRMDDEKLIRKRLEYLGYNIRSSKGKVVFLWDNDIWTNLDIRNCVLYAERE